MMDALLQDIKHNCDISDARFWGFFSICGLLMRYLDLYRSEQGLPPWSPAPREEIGRWIQRKESQWPELEQREFVDLTVDGRRFQPFDLAGVNEALRGSGWVYGAGYGIYLKPTFFLARVIAHSERDGHTVHTVREEKVRDLFSAPAMLQGRTIFIRLEPLRTLLWDKYSQLASGPGSALAEAFRSFGIEPGQPPDTAFEQQLDRMTGVYADILVRHELAESRESLLAWKECLVAVDDRSAEHYLRALQDLIADTSAAGPLAHIAGGRDAGTLSLYVGLLEGYRRLLFPEIVAAWRRFRKTRDWSPVDEARQAGHARFLALRREVLALDRGGNREALRHGLRQMARAAG